MALLTVGHGPQGRDALGARLTGAGISRLVDVRRFPGSRNNPDVQREALEEWLPALGIGYRWDDRLGGRRRLPPGEPVEDDWWTVAQFAAYAAHTRTPEFAAALDDVLAAAERRRRRGDVQRERLVALPPAADRRRRRPRPGCAGHPPHARRPADPAPPLGGCGARRRRPRPLARGLMTQET